MEGWMLSSIWCEVAYLETNRASKGARGRLVVRCSDAARGKTAAQWHIPDHLASTHMISRPVKGPDFQRLISKANTSDLGY